MRALALFFALSVACKSSATKCKTNTDCDKGLACLNAVCVKSTCGDGVKDAGESDIDCGAVCAPCVDGKVCAQGSDCQSKYCANGTCLGSSCSDGLKNGDESDIDCGGGTCPKCTNTKACTTNSDCQSNLCAANVCVNAACTDKIQDQDESDVDCGGTVCARCATGQKCAIASDCGSDNCLGNACEPARCDDQTQDGTETDVDCGGSCANKCATGQSCTLDGDCAGNVCNAGSCADCRVDGDCAAGECRTAKCQTGKCNYTNLADTAVLTQLAGDCARRVCDGQGNEQAVYDATDTPADSVKGDCKGPACSAIFTANLSGAVNASDTPSPPSGGCVSASCEGNSPTFLNIGSGASCSGGVCNGSGACVQCVDPGQCGGKACVANRCAACSDSSQCGNQVCAGGECIACSAANKCPDGNYCRVDTSVCVAPSACQAQYNCVDLTTMLCHPSQQTDDHFCGISGRVCVDCTTLGVPASCGGDINNYGTCYIPANDCSAANCPSPHSCLTTSHCY